jgi:pimeloyl-ACP methyl ester carboxylesterase
MLSRVTMPISRGALVLLFFALASGGCARSRLIPKSALEKKYANPSSRFIEIMDMRIHYRDEGEGPALVLLHGMGASLHTWDGWVEALGKDYRIVRMDLPGFGLSDPPAAGKGFTIEAGVRFMEAFLGALGIETCAMAGNSMGGWIAWEFAAAHPEAVGKLILIDAAGLMTPQDVPPVIKRMKWPIVKKIMLKGVPKFFIRKFVRSAYGDKKKLTKETLARYIDLFNGEGNTEAFLKIAHAAVEIHDEKLASIKAPTLILWGKKDRWLKVKYAARFHKAIAGSKLIVYDGAGHVPMEEIPEKTAADAASFLAAAPAP